MERHGVEQGALLHNLILEGELIRIVGALSDDGIGAIVLKGIPLIQRLSGRLDARHLIDNDILVQRADVTRACDRLLALGYRHLAHGELEPQLAIDFQYALVASVHGDLAFADLHWGAFHPILYRVPEELLWAHTEPFDLRGFTLKIFDKPLTIVHLAAHFAQHGFSEPRILREIASAWNLWAPGLNLEELLALAGQAGQLHALDYALSCARDLQMLEADPPAIRSTRSRLLRSLLPAARLHKARPRHDYWRTLLSLLLADPARIPAWCLPHLLPPIENMAAIHQRPVSRTLFFRYFTRPFRPFARMLGRKLGSP